MALEHSSFVLQILETKGRFHIHQFMNLRAINKTQVNKYVQYEHNAKMTSTTIKIQSD